MPLQFWITSDNRLYYIKYEQNVQKVCLFAHLFVYLPALVMLLQPEVPQTRKIAKKTPDY